ncbi:hypothetical protein [Vibrio quintilis]|uniref:N-acetyltransferase domain-containing protein n=1 Tax=Vibrio quintilis TaxID=1117707 RepID=A0A1M7YRG0_9VIBR|nr:hypothetical protein [Vibrio quintilis]SHO55126.1 hypothetical protein VQ7734_00845 [Vibrio quintilis]
MKFTLIRHDRADIQAQFSFLRPAFNGVPAAKYEYQFCRDAVISKQASFYQLKGRGVAVRFVGLVTDSNDYLILALTGRGLKQAVPHIIRAVQSQGYSSLRYHTVRPGMTRMLRALGFQRIRQEQPETVMSLDLGVK